ncbi:hypothetical protein AB0L82_14615 [Nocardia sp. NPDC052001]|uniref:hypothetical protein n=1 Tax=unclassified Nocardia TaxID=2637762 RepID=UPI00343828F4
MSRKANTPQLDLDDTTQKTLSGADACWPEPSPLASWWEEVMFDGADAGSRRRDIA